MNFLTNQKHEKLTHKIYYTYMVVANLAIFLIWQLRLSCLYCPSTICLVRTTLSSFDIISHDT